MPHARHDLAVENLRIGRTLDAAPTEPFNTKYSGCSFRSFSHPELGAAVLAVRDVGVDLALHHIKLVIDGRQTAFGLDEDEPVHAAGRKSMVAILKKMLQNNPMQSTLAKREFVRGSTPD